MWVAGVKGAGAMGCVGGGEGGTRFVGSGLGAKSVSRAERTSDLDRRNGVGGVLDWFGGEVCAVVAPVDEGRDC